MSFSIILGPFTIICMLAGFVFIMGGWILRKYPPKKINHWYGYRTPSSKMNQERWDFAQKYSASWIIRTGLALILLGSIGLFIEISYEKSVWLALISVIFTTSFMIMKVERAIRKKFNDQ